MIGRNPGGNAVFASGIWIPPTPLTWLKVGIEPQKYSWLNGSDFATPSAFSTVKV